MILLVDFEKLGSIIQIIFNFLVAIKVLGLLIYYGWTQKPEQKGKRGEKKVSDELKKIPGIVLDNYVFIGEDGKSHQIDHILLCDKGVFVIETKAYKGKIYGNENQLEWTQSFHYGNYKSKFYNPIKQNNTHTYHLNYILQNRMVINSFVVFIYADIKEISSDKVIYINEILSRISKFPTIYTVDQVNQICHCLLKYKSEDISMSDHISNIKATQRAINNNVCPRCGSPLILKKGKYGQFYGCSSYPKCKFIKKDS
ncbi:MAG: NERD domain-containing protein [Bacilli bacterium]|nr:NERD domain-containing protein [Bacilli bacterium]